MHIYIVLLVSSFHCLLSQWRANECVSDSAQGKVPDIREPNQQGFQRSRAMGGETHFFHPSTDTKQEIAVMCESTCPVVMADAHL